MKKVLILIIKGYKKVISPLLPPSCRFYPSCSTYAIQSLEKYGILKGSIKAIYRILRCNPFNKGGYDPVK
ncbi:MAG: membrane protein insertion efficiency factor YidD [Candidatus Humimicrobiaceae bacterium]